MQRRNPFVMPPGLDQGRDTAQDEGFGEGQFHDAHQDDHQVYRHGAADAGQPDLETGSHYGDQQVTSEADRGGPGSMHHSGAEHCDSGGHHQSDERLGLPSHGESFHISGGAIEYFTCDQPARENNKRGVPQENRDTPLNLSAWNVDYVTNEEQASLGAVSAPKLAGCVSPIGGHYRRCLHYGDPWQGCALPRSPT